jgi:hypothetical protein
MRLALKIAYSLVPALQILYLFIIVFIPDTFPWIFSDMNIYKLTNILILMGGLLNVGFLILFVWSLRSLEKKTKIQYSFLLVFYPFPALYVLYFIWKKADKLTTQNKEYKTNTQ